MEKVLVISGQAKNTLAVFFDAIYTSLYKMLRLMKKLTKVKFESKYTYILECLYAIKIVYMHEKRNNISSKADQLFRHLVVGTSHITLSTSIAPTICKIIFICAIDLSPLTF